MKGPRPRPCSATTRSAGTAHAKEVVARTRPRSASGRLSLTAEEHPSRLLLNGPSAKTIQHDYHSRLSGHKPVEVCHRRSRNRRSPLAADTTTACRAADAQDLIRIQDSTWDAAGLAIARELGLLNILPECQPKAAEVARLRSRNERYVFENCVVFAQNGTWTRRIVDPPLPHVRASFAELLITDPVHNKQSRKKPERHSPARVQLLAEIRLKMDATAGRKSQVMGKLTRPRSASATIVSNRGCDKPSALGERTILDEREARAKRWLVNGDTNWHTNCVPNTLQLGIDKRFILREDAEVDVVACSV